MSEVAATGSSILTQGAPPPVVAGAGGTPANANGPVPPANGTEAAVKARPEWAPEKFWKSDKGELDGEGLGKSYQSLEKLLGREKVPVPVSEDDNDGWQRWYVAGGRPEKADDYEFARPDNLPETLSYDDDLEKNFRSAALSSGLNKKQAGALYDQFVKHQTERAAAWETTQKQAKAQVEIALQREHGAQYPAFLTQAKQAIGQYADEEFKQFLDSSGLGNDPRMIRMMGRIGKEIGGETRLNGRVEPQVNTADMQTKISEFRSQHSKVLFDRSHPDHESRVKQLAGMYEAVYGDAPAA